MKFLSPIFSALELYCSSICLMIASLFSLLLVLVLNTRNMFSTWLTTIKERVGHRFNHLQPQIVPYNSEHLKENGRKGIVPPRSF